MITCVKQISSKIKYHPEETGSKRLDRKDMSEN